MKRIYNCNNLLVSGEHILISSLNFEVLDVLQSLEAAVMHMVRY